MNKKILALSLSVISVLTLILGIYFTKNLQKKAPADLTSALTTEAQTVATAPSTTEAQTVATAPSTTEAQTVATTPSQTSSENRITSEQAINIALTAAGFTEAEVWDKEAELDYEKGVLVYEVSFEKDHIDYDYIIDAQSGEIIRTEVDPY